MISRAALIKYHLLHLKRVTRQHYTVRPQIADRGDSLQEVTRDFSLMNNQSWKTEKGWFSVLGCRYGDNSSSA
jgi:hypothetical protein